MYRYDNIYVFGVPAVLRRGVGRVRPRDPPGGRPLVLGDRSGRGRLAGAAALAPYDPLHLLRHLLVGGTQHPRPREVLFRRVLQREVVLGDGERLVVFGIVRISAARRGAVVVSLVWVACVVVIIRVIPDTVAEPAVAVSPAIIFITPVSLPAIAGPPVVPVLVLRRPPRVVAYHHVQHGLPLVHHVVHTGGGGRRGRRGRRSSSVAVSAGRRLVLGDGAVEGNRDGGGREGGAAAVLAGAAHLGAVAAHTHACAGLQPERARSPLGRLAHVAALEGKGRLVVGGNWSIGIISDLIR